MHLIGLIIAFVVLIVESRTCIEIDGGLSPVNPTSADYVNRVRPLLESALTEYRQSEYHMVIVAEEEVFQQVVAGIMYHLKATIAQTDCSEADYDPSQRDSCADGVDDGGEYCALNALFDLDGTVKILKLDCE